MRNFILGADGKTCIWPIPASCIWTGEIYAIKKEIRMLVNEVFRKEGELFAELLERHSTFRLKITDEKPDVALLKHEDEKCVESKYILEAGEKGVVISANECKGALYGCMTLLQLILHSPGSYIPGVSIVDMPLRPIRAISIQAVPDSDKAWIEKFVEFLIRYKINGIYFKNMPAAGIDESILQYIKGRHVEILTDEEFSKYKDFCMDINESCDDNQPAIRKNIYRILKAACLWWWKGAGAYGKNDQYLLPEWMERILAQLYPMERVRSTGNITSGSFLGNGAPSVVPRKRLSEVVFSPVLNMEPSVFPALKSGEYNTLDIRRFYNAPLYRLCWKNDDYDYMFMIEAKYIPNTVPFSVLQGVKDYKQDYAFILAGNGWNKGIFDIPVKRKARRLCFLHSCITDRKYFRQPADENCHEPVIGSYVVHYSDGFMDKAEIAYGRSILHWNAGCGANWPAYDASPVYRGITSFNAPYAVYSYEWVNSRPDSEIEKVDVIPSENFDEAGIALFAISALINEPDRRDSFDCKKNIV